jgi:hypothetical protein
MQILIGNLKGRLHFGDLGVDGTIILKWALRMEGVMMWTGFVWLGIRSVVGCYEVGNEHFVTVEAGLFP